MMELDLGKIREEIDKTDKGIVELYHRRMELVEQVAGYKIATGKQVLDKERENAKIRTLGGMAQDEFDRHAIEEIFTQLMSVSRKMQYGLLREAGKLPALSFREVESLQTKGCRVCYQGVEGAYSHAVLRQYFGDQVSDYHVAHFEDVMQEVAEGRADYGVLPIENSSAGMVSDVYDLLVQYDNIIAAEAYIKVDHGLLVLPGTELSDIKTVYSHPQGLMQCAGYLKKHPDWKCTSLENTAVSAKKVLADGDPSQAAIASPAAAKLYGLQVLACPINDNDRNTTRFIIVQKEAIYQKKAGKISLWFEIAHESGSLYAVLSNLIYNGINMTKIESRPIPEKPFEYRFYVDIEGNLASPAVQNALIGMQEEVNAFRILGNY